MYFFFYQIRDIISTSDSKMVTSFGLHTICLFLCCSAVFAVNRPTFGVIRWDAWNLVNGKYDEISFYSHRSMTPEHYHYRLPFFAKINPDGNLTYNADSQEIMDQEILYAKFAGLDYWAFDTYCSFGPNCSTNSPYCAQYYQQTSTRYCPENPSYGLMRYLSSRYASLINFTFILLGSSPCGDEFQEQYLEFMVHPQFQTVLGERPLIYLFQFDDQEAQACAGGWEGSAKVFQNFRQKVISRGEHFLFVFNKITFHLLFIFRFTKSIFGSNG